MSEFLEQRACIKFCFKLGKKCSETIEMMRQVFGAECLSRKQIYQWFNRFKNGRESIEQDRIPGRPTSSTNKQAIERVNEMITENRHLTVRQISEELGISVGSVHRILTDKLGMRCSADGFNPKLIQKDVDKLPRASTSNLSSSNKRKRSDSEGQGVVDKYKKILRATPTATSTSIVQEIMNSTGLSKTAVCRIIKEAKESGEIPERKRVRVRHAVEFTNIDPVIENVKGIIDAFTERNEYPSVYQVYTELKHHKDIPKMSQTMLYKIMKQIASTENSSNMDNSEVSEDSDEGSESDSNNIKRANHIEHIELNPDITMDYYEESTPAIKEEPDDKLNG